MIFKISKLILAAGIILSSFVAANPTYPPFIQPQNFEIFATQPPVIESEDSVLGFYYNVLLPQEEETDDLNAFIQYFRGEIEGFPLSEAEFSKTHIFVLNNVALRVLQSYYAEYTSHYLEQGFQLEDSLEKALQDVSKNYLPIFVEKIKQIEESLQYLQDNSLLKQRYELLLKVPRNAVKNLADVLSFRKQTLLSNKDNIHALLEDSINIGKPQELFELIRWDHRIKPLTEVVNKVTQLAPQSPFFLGLQEVTADSLTDLKLKFPDFTWISYNNATGQETRPSSSGPEAVLGEFSSFTNTLGLSPGLKLIRKEIGKLPSESGVSYQILGVEVLNEKTGKKFAIFTTHTDYLIKNDIYKRTAVSIHQFIERFLQDTSLPFILGGDLNAFEDRGGNEFIDFLKNHGPLNGSLDYRDKGLHCHPEIALTTFPTHRDLGLPLPKNALDHIFLQKMDILWAIREAGTFDAKGKIIDPFTEEEAFLQALEKRWITSDHFLNAVLFKLVD